MKRTLALCAALVVLISAGAAQTAPRSQHGFLLGVQVQPRKIAGLAYNAGIHDANELVTAVAICLAESQGFDHAYNDNVDANGKVVSRDVSLWEINIPASQIGTQTEAALYDRENNAAAMYQLYQARGWQPWVAYTTGAYLHDSYIRRASLGVMNYLAERLVLRARAAGQSPTTPVPEISQKQFATFLPLYP